MKKYRVALVGMMILALGLMGCGAAPVADKEATLTAVTVGEVTHSILCAPATYMSTQSDI